MRAFFKPYIAKEAYRLWEISGRPNGSDLCCFEEKLISIDEINWIKAERIIQERINWQQNFLLVK